MDKPYTKFLCPKCYVEAEPNTTPLVTAWTGNCQKCGTWEQLYFHRSRAVLYPTTYHEVASGE